MPTLNSLYSHFRSACWWQHSYRACAITPIKSEQTSSETARTPSLQLESSSECQSWTQSRPDRPPAWSSVGAARPLGSVQAACQAWEEVWHSVSLGRPWSAPGALGLGCLAKARGSRLERGRYCSERLWRGPWLQSQASPGRRSSPWGSPARSVSATHRWQPC